MVLSRQLSLSVLLSVLNVPEGLCRRHGGFRHEAADILRGREVPLENVTVPVQCPIPSPTSVQTQSTLFPSPSADPVHITTQSQVVESYIPEMTWCVGPPIGLIPMTNIARPPYQNLTTMYSMTQGGSGRCETVYTPTMTTVCATTLTGLASKVTVSRCDQEITFSSECGFTLENSTPTRVSGSLITPAPTVKRLMTYYLAPWQSLTLGDTPSDVDMKVCTIISDDTMRCRRRKEVWEVVVVTSTFTTEREIQILTTIAGPGTLFIETLRAEITDTLVFFNMSTTLLIETLVEIESTSRAIKPWEPVTESEVMEKWTSTTYMTRTLKYKSPFPSVEPTSTVRVTSATTEYYGTITRTTVRLPSTPTLSLSPMQL